MLQKLINKTNSEEFYNDCNFHLESYSYKALDCTLELFFLISKSSDYVSVENEKWKITCRKTEIFNGFYNTIMLPYVKLAIFDSHPLLMEYHESELECEIVGRPKKSYEFIGEIHSVLEKETGNWITLNKYLWNFEKYFTINSKRLIYIPNSLMKPIQMVCNRHDLGFNIKSETKGEDKGYLNKPKAKLLIFGNEDVSPNQFFLNQSYVIAEEFIEERIEIK